MASPYGIEQVDIPGLLGMHAQMKRQRLQDLYTAREMEMQDRKQQLEERKLGALAKVFDTGDQPSHTPAPATVAPVMAPTPSPSLSQEEGNAIIAKAHAAKTITPVEADRVRRSLGPNGGAAFEKWMTDNGIIVDGGQGGPEAVQEAPIVPLDQDLPPRTDGLKINQDALRQLYAIDPAQASQIQKMVYDSDKQGLEAATRRGEAMANVALRLQKLAPSDRSAELQRWAPYLAERGFPAQSLQQADLSDAGLQRYLQQGRQIEQIIASEKPDLRVIPLGGTLYDVGKRGNVAANAPQVGQVVDGYRYKGGDLNSQSSWEKAN